MRINDLARELEVKSKAVLEYLLEIGITEKRSHSTLEDELADKVRVHFRGLAAWEGAAAVTPTAPLQGLLRAPTVESPKTVTTHAEPPRVTRTLDQIKAAARRALAQPKPAPLVEKPAPATPPALPVGALGILDAARGGGAPGRIASDAGTVGSAERIKTDALPESENAATVTLPEQFTFYQSSGLVSFDRALRVFDWSLSNTPVTVDLTHCRQANFQALSLLIPYLWKLTAAGCTVTVKYGGTARSASSMIEKMGATAWKEILLADDGDFEPRVAQAAAGRKMLYALRLRSDVKNVINHVRSAINTYEIEFPDYLSYIVSELLYNATEHGRRSILVDGRPLYIPAIIEFGYYPQTSRLRFIFADVGMGIKAHLEQAYPAYLNHREAIIHSLQPNVSGTFGRALPYAVQDNAGMGLTYSSRMLKRLKADMYIISYDGLVHISPEDITSRQLRNSWPGTFVLVDLDLRSSPKIDLDGLLDEIRKKANEEASEASAEEQARKFSLSVFNFFGRFAEDKDAAIHFRDKYLIPAIEGGKTVEIDFRDVETAPHSFLSALLATPIQRVGLKAYKRIKPLNASGSIRQVFDAIMDANTPQV